MHLTWNGVAIIEVSKGLLISALLPSLLFQVLSVYLMLLCCTYMPIEATLQAGYLAQLMYATYFTLEASVFAMTTKGTFPTYYL